MFVAEKLFYPLKNEVNSNITYHEKEHNQETSKAIKFKSLSFEVPHPAGVGSMSIHPSVFGSTPAHPTAPPAQWMPLPPPMHGVPNGLEYLARVTLFYYV